MQQPDIANDCLTIKHQATKAGVAPGYQYESQLFCLPDNTRGMILTQLLQQDQHGLRPNGYGLLGPCHLRHHIGKHCPGPDSGGPGQGRCSRPTHPEPWSRDLGPGGRRTGQRPAARRRGKIPETPARGVSGSFPPGSGHKCRAAHATTEAPKNWPD